ncbi:armadillo-like helical domain-containing protein 4 isoform X2 [Nannospalax galili]|uniref:armadillo-like helical domain-containing protein 4 isoform X2 n=1 Tax=Nannospalax galili TaxID=1026970 RepID=UPI00111C1E7D|nr:armadillo-like helical domain-containing protein 4 isoform X2 [Nannospalax galili]
MNKQQSEASSPWRPRQPRESRPLQGPRQGCRAPAPPPSSARSSAEGAQDSVAGIVNSSNLYVHFSSTMSRATVLHICLAFCSLLFLSFTTQCLAFPKVERREIADAYAEKGQSERMDIGDQENSSITPEHKPQQMSSDDPTVLSARPSMTPLSGLLHPNSPGLHFATEPVVPAREEAHGSSQLEKTSPEHRLSKAMLTIAVTTTASLNSDQEGPFSSSSIQPPVEEITEATQGFLKYTDNQLFATESQEGVSLGQSPSSYINTKEMLTTEPRIEKVEGHVVQRTTSFPGVDFTADTKPDGKASQTTPLNVQATATKHLLATSEYVLSVEPETDSLLGAPQITVSVSTAVSVASLLSDEWDDTKLESVSQIRPPELGDNAETQMKTEPSETTYASPEGTEGGPTSTEAAEVSPGLPEGETHVGTALLIAPEDEQALDERSPVFTHLSSFTPLSLTEDPEVSVVNLFPSTGGSTASMEEDSATIFSETTISLSQYESESYQPVGNVLKDITQEMTTDTQEPDATLPLVTQEQLEVPRGSGEPEEGKTSLSPVPDAAGTTQLSRIWESLATPASTTAIPLSLEVTSAEDLLDTVTGPNEEFIPVLGSPVTSSAVTVEAPTISPVPPSEVSHSNTASSYGLEQLESEEEDEDEEDEEDEEEEDEEEDEEDKDADSLVENFDGDTELPGFTVPGITSQEPDIEPGSLDLLERATYQVPDAIEWEQQNQGLVRSWMEKLKDKAGYMSGMLVPVGVGIAGALFILGALYSIKVMNRRRRNGFKRHKRKQREFNSMQDRVMLLADSSEDEF